MFEKGKSGNPGGRPKDSKWVRELAQRRTEDAIRALTDALTAEHEWTDSEGETHSEPDHKIRVLAANALLDRGWGKPRQEITGEDGGAIKIDGSAGLLDTLKRLAGE
jgi:hypothetical protein